MRLLPLEVKVTGKLKGAVGTVAKSKSIMDSKRQQGLHALEMKVAVLSWDWISQGDSTGRNYGDVVNTR
jgi:hypothetical protein